MLKKALKISSLKSVKKFPETFLKNSGNNSPRNIPENPQRKSIGKLLLAK